MSTFTTGEFKDALKTQLEARGNLAGVTIYDAELDTGKLDREHIVLGDWSQQETPIAMGTVWAETYDVEGRIIIRKPGSAKAARDRALVLLKEVKDQLITDHTGNTTVWEAHIDGYEAVEDLWSDQGRECRLEFTIRVEAHHTA